MLNRPLDSAPRTRRGRAVLRWANENWTADGRDADILTQNYCLRTTGRLLRSSSCLGDDRHIASEAAALAPRTHSSRAGRAEIWRQAAGAASAPYLASIQS